MPRPVLDETVTIGGPLAQTGLEPVPDVLDPDRGDVPLRQDDQGRALRLAGDVGDREVLVDQPFGGVDQDECDVGPLGRLQRSQLRVVLDPLALAALAPEPRRVDEDERAVPSLDDRVDRVARGAGTSETITRSSPTSVLRRLDFPTFGRPRIATRIASSEISGRFEAPGRRSRIVSSRSPVP